MCVWPGWGEEILNKQPLAPVSAKAPCTPPPRTEAACWTMGQGASSIHLVKKNLVFCLSLPQPDQIVSGCPSCSPSPLGLSPPYPLSGEQSRGPPALDRKLSALLAHRASFLTTGKAGCLPPARLAETQLLFPAAARKSPRPGLPWGPCSLQISWSGNFPCAVFQAGRASRTKGKERQQLSSPLHHTPAAHPRAGRHSGQRLFPGSMGRGYPENRHCPSWGGLCFWKQSLQGLGPDHLEQFPYLPALPYHGGNSPVLPWCPNRA